MLWVGIARTQLVQPTKTFCDRPAEGYGVLFTNQDLPSQRTLAKAAQNARAKGYTPIIGTFADDRQLLGGQEQNLTEASAYTTETLEQTRTAPPNSVNSRGGAILVGIIEPNGSVKPLP